MRVPHRPVKGKQEVVGRVASALSALSPSRNARRVPERVGRVGVILQWGIGDAVLATPLLRGLREAYPDAAIELVGKPWLRELFEGTGLVDGVHDMVPPWTKYRAKYRPWQPEWAEYLRALSRVRRVPFDVAVGVRYDPRELLQLRLFGARFRVGYGAAGGSRWLDLDLGAPPHITRPAHVAAAAAYAAEALTGRKVDPRPRLDATGAVVDQAREALHAAGYTGGLILALSPGAGIPLREWGADRFEAVLRSLSDRIGFLVLIADPQEERAMVRAPPELPSMVWRSGLRELRGLLSVADLLLCNDSGVMHVAAACGCPVVALFGPQLPTWFGPYIPLHEVVAVEPMPCRPCFDQCIYERPICMDGVRPDAVVRAIVQLSARLDPPRIRSQPALK